MQIQTSASAGLQTSASSRMKGLSNPWYRSGGFSKKWMHIVALLAVVFLINTLLSYQFSGRFDIFFTCFGLYLLMVAALLIYIYTMKKDEILLHKSTVLYPGKTWIENEEGAPVLCSTFSFGSSFQRAASYVAEIPVRTIRHMYFQPSSGLLYIDGDFLAVRTDQSGKKPVSRGTTWNGAWIVAPAEGRTDFFRNLHEHSRLPFESIR